MQGIDPEERGQTESDPAPVPASETEIYGESDGVRGFSAGLGLHFFGIPVVAFLFWLLVHFFDFEPYGGPVSSIWYLTLSYIGVTQVVYMLPAYFVAKYMKEPKSYMRGLLLSAGALFAINAALAYFLWG